MAIEDYLCSLLLSTCGHALLATGLRSDMKWVRRLALPSSPIPHTLSKRIQIPRPRKLGPRAFQQIIILAGEAACRSLGKEKIGNINELLLSSDNVSLPQSKSCMDTFLTPPLSLSTLCRSLKTAEKDLVSVVTWTFSYSRAHARMQCKYVYVCEN